MKQRSKKWYSIKRISPKKSKKPAPKVVVDDVDIEQQNQNEHTDVERMYQCGKDYQDQSKVLWSMEVVAQM